MAEHVDAARADVLAFTAFSKEIWRPTWSDDPSDRLNPGEPPHRRRRRPPDRNALILVGAAPTEEHDE